MRPLILAVLLLMIPAVAAHGDQSSLIGSFELAPGDSITFERAVHWHRVMGHLEADGDIRFLVNGEQVAGPARTLTLDHLIRCCDATWTDFAFEVQNLEARAITVEADVAFLHDNLAVVADDAEAGAWWQTAMILGFALGIPALLAHQPITGDPGRWLVSSRWLHGAAWLAATTMALIGMVRFGSGPIVGHLGATAGFPGAVGQIFNTHSLIMLATMALWSAGYACLAAGRRRGAGAGIDGGVYVLAPLLVGTAMLVELGASWSTVLVAVLPAALIAADLYGRRLRAAWPRTSGTD